MALSGETTITKCDELVTSDARGVHTSPATPVGVDTHPMRYLDTQQRVREVSKHFS
ncbi:hypothetical protein C8Q74DRAFT_208887 [Fomes fomentarius]|nr:hypothetical protein C8Q74DRAFT_208887 [Fomes fomentarius]